MDFRIGAALAGGLAGLAAFVSAPAFSQSPADAALEASCRATEVTSPQSCPCTITKARAAGVNDEQLASLFKDDGHTSPVPPAKYSVFWQVKSQCIADAMMASLGVSPDNPLPGVPDYMRPKMPGANPPKSSPPGSTSQGPPPPTTTPAPPPAAGKPAPPASIPAASTAKASQPGKPDIAAARANVAKLMGNAYEYTEEGGKQHRFDFLAEDQLVIYQTYDPGAEPNYRRFVEVGYMSVEETQFGPQYVLRLVDSGNFTSHPIQSVADDHFIYNARFVRTSEQWKYRKVGAAKREFLEEGPQPLDDGFWQPPFRYALDKTNPFFDRNFRLAGWTNAINRDAYQEEFASGQGLIQIKYTESEECNHNCILVLNDFDTRARQVRKRVIEHVGVDTIGVRAEETPYRVDGRTPPSQASLRAYDGYGGYTQWLCVRDGRLTCRETAKVAPPPAQAAAGGSIAARLGSVTGEAVGDAQCFQYLYRAPASGVPTTLAGMLRLSRTGDAAMFATATDIPGTMDGGIKINLDGRDIVLAPTGAQGTYSNGGITLKLGKPGQSITDNPAYAFSPLTVILTINGQSESVEAVNYGGC